MFGVMDLDAVTFGIMQMLDILNPIHIIRYGAKQDGERSEISTFFDNDNKRSARHGW